MWSATLCGRGAETTSGTNRVVHPVQSQPDAEAKLPRCTSRPWDQQGNANVTPQTVNALLGLPTWLAHPPTWFSSSWNARAGPSIGSKVRNGPEKHGALLTKFIIPLRTLVGVEACGCTDPRRSRGAGTHGRTYDWIQGAQ
jgi:hypothetical protein